METKKTKRADIERLRPQAFLLGVVVAVAAMVAAAGWVFEPDDPLDDPELLARLDAEEDLGPLQQPDNEMMLAPTVKPEPVAELKIVDEAESSEQDARQEQAVDKTLESETPDDMTSTDDEEEDKDKPLEARVVDDVPQFPGGLPEFIKWLTRNLRYPDQCQSAKVQGKVVAQFIVGTDGQVSDVKVVRSLHPLCDAETLRVLRLMPRWTPGMNNEKPCRTLVCVPVMFRLF